jgi:hypothetical protein
LACKLIDFVAGVSGFANLGEAQSTVGRITMTPQDLRYIQNLRFRLRVYQSDGQAYEDFFTQIMLKRYTDFRQVKPQGTLGDRKNDGFIPSTGTYHQVFAPEDVYKGDVYGGDKLEADFKGLLKNWDQAGQVRRFFYTLNDKFKGAGPTVEQTIDKLRRKHAGKTIASFLAAQLGDEFMRLSEDHQNEILGGMTPEIDGELLDASALSEVVSYLLKNTTPPQYLAYTPDPDFVAKITFNALTEITVATLRHYNVEANAVLPPYFKYKPKSERQQLALIFSQMYQKGRQLFAGDPQADDLVFFYILEHCAPSKRKFHQQAVFVLMSYFFETCDIFETPPKKP